MDILSTKCAREPRCVDDERMESATCIFGLYQREEQIFFLGSGGGNWWQRNKTQDSSHSLKTEQKRKEENQINTRVYLFVVTEWKTLCLLTGG